MATQRDLSVANCIADLELRAAAQSLGRVLAHQESQATMADLANTVVQFPLFPEATRPVSNDMARSALLSCVQGGDRLLLHHAALAAIGGVTIACSGEQLNQDDCDTLMQLVFMARGQPLGAFVMVSAYAVLKGLGRQQGKREHDQLRREIERLTQASVTLRSTTIHYTGHLIDEAMQDVRTRHWLYRFNVRLREFFGLDHYTLIDWEKRKNLQRKNLARWLQLSLSTHARPFPVRVGHVQRLSGSRAALRECRRLLKDALTVLTANGDIDPWAIEQATDRVYVDRGTVMSDSQRRHVAKKPSRIDGIRPTPQRSAGRGIRPTGLTGLDPQQHRIRPTA